ncbi:MAG TPA: hypothetical protein VIF63_09720 [Candidatus Limnocylindrales bacterium]|jgi:hypothetical protein
MLNEVSFRLMHRHGDDYEPMVEHTSADHDPEKGWLRGARIFRCRSCEEEVVLVPPTNEPGDTSA